MGVNRKRRRNLRRDGSDVALQGFDRGTFSMAREASFIAVDARI